MTAISQSTTVSPSTNLPLPPPAPPPLPVFVVPVAPAIPQNILNLLASLSGQPNSGAVPAAVTAPIALGDGNHTLTNNTAKAVITGGNGNNTVTEQATGVRVTLGSGNNTITDIAGHATIVTGSGDQIITLGGTANQVTVGNTAGGHADTTIINAGTNGATVAAGNGNMMITVSGTSNTVTVGSGNDVITVNGQGGGNSGNIVNLGSGSNMVFLNSSGNTINAGHGIDTINATGWRNEAFVVSKGGSETIIGFTANNGDRLDLTKALAGVDLAHDLSNIGNYVSITSHGANAILAITDGNAMETVTLLGIGGATSLSSLLSHNSVVLPWH